MIAAALSLLFLSVSPAPGVDAAALLSGQRSIALPRLRLCFRNWLRWCLSLTFPSFCRKVDASCCGIKLAGGTVRAIDGKQNR